MSAKDWEYCFKVGSTSDLYHSGEADMCFCISSGYMPGPRHSHAAAVVGINMYVYGGVRDCGQAITGDLHVLDMGCLIWRRIDAGDSCSRPPPPLFSHTLTVLGRDRLVLIGGCPEQDTGERILRQHKRWD